MASAAEYKAARDRAAKVRAEAKHPELRGALAMLFPSEPWGTEEARSFDPKRPGRGVPASIKAATLLLANTDWATAERLMRGILDNPYGGSDASPPVYALLDRFGARAEPLVRAAFDRNLKEGSTVECEWIAGALACIGSSDVAALFQQRGSKQTGKTAALTFAKRFPELARATRGEKPQPAKRSAARYAVVGDFEVWSVHDKTFDGVLRRWQGMTPTPRRWDDWGDLEVTAAKRKVGLLLDAWREKEALRIDARKGSVSIRGVLPAEVVSRRGVELFSLFRQEEVSPLQFDGDLLVFSPDLENGYRLALYEKGGSSFERLDEAPEAEEEIAALLAPAPPKKPASTKRK
jgi:hypothetical protein